MIPCLLQKGEGCHRTTHRRTEKMRLQGTLLLTVVLGTAVFSDNAASHDAFWMGGGLIGGMLEAPAAPKDTTMLPAQWFQQNLDHFDSQNTGTWKQRFFVNSTFHKPGNPVFLQIGGESPADTLWITAGEMMDQAQQHGAMAILLEHRYYGESHPTSDLSLENIKYLSSEQALADLANFRDQFGQEQNVSGSKWVTFGGSYPGSLSAWARLKYPHFFHAAVASSAPVWAKLNFTQYLEVVQASISTDGGDDCLSNIREGMADVGKMLASEEGRDQLATMFRMCASVPIGQDRLSAAMFANRIALIFMKTVQYNNIGIHKRLNISFVCRLMTDGTAGSPVKRLSMVYALLLKKSHCMPTYNMLVSLLKNTAWSSVFVRRGQRQWMYQVCHELGSLQSSQSNASAEPFGDLFPVDTQTQLCTDVFGVSAAELANDVAWTNRQYCSTGIKGSRIVFPNGDIDPWHVLSVLPTTPNLPKDIDPVLIHGTAHCANMFPSSPEDPPSLVKARMVISKIVDRYIQAEDED